MKKNSGFAPILILLLVLALGAIGYFSYKNLNTKLPTSTTQPTVTDMPTSDPTANWKTYNNSNFGFSFKYPSDWAVKPLLIQGSGNTQEIKSPDKTFLLSVVVKGNYNNGTGKEFSNLREYAGFPYDGKKINIDGQAGMQYLPRAGSENVNSVDFYSLDKKWINTIELQSGSNPMSTPIDIVKQGEKYFDQILSTFKFAEKKVKLTLPVSILHTGYAFDDGNLTKFKYPTNIDVLISEKFNDQIAAYGVGEKVIIGPKNWSGSGEMGADGTSSIDLSNPKDVNKTHGIFIAVDTGCVGCILAEASAYFRNAKEEYLKDFPGPIDTIDGLIVTKVTDKLVRYSINDNNSKKIKIGAAYYSSGNMPFFTKEEIDLTSIDSDLAQALVDIFISQYNLDN